MNDRQVAVTAAVLRSERYLTIQKIKQKLINNLGQVVQGHVQDGTGVRSLTHHMSLEHSDRSPPNINDYDKYEVMNKTKNDITEILTTDNKNEKEQSRRQGNEYERREGETLGDINPFNRGIIKELHHNIGGDRKEIVKMNMIKNKRRDGARGMDIEKVLRTCQDAVQRNNASVQYLKNSKTL